MSAQALNSGPPAPSMWELLNTTPLSDVVRGRLTGRVNWRKPIRESGLPPEIAIVLLEVVVATRLWRTERRVVAQELVAHFVDGIAAGRSQAELIASFGDPKTTAVLIRRARKRVRPLAWRASVQSLRWTLFAAGTSTLLAALIYGAIWLWFISGEVVVSRNYAAEWAARAWTAPEPDDAWHLYRQAFALVRQAPPVLDIDQDLSNPSPKWAASWLAEHEEYLCLVREGAGRARLSLPHVVTTNTMTGVSPNDAAWNDLPNDEPRFAADAAIIESGAVMLAHVHSPFWRDVNTGFRALLLDAWNASEDGDAHRAYRDVSALLGLCEQLLAQDELIGRLVGATCADRLSRFVLRSTWRSPDLWSSAQLRDLAHRLAAFGRGRIALPFEHERDLVADLLQRVYTDNGSGDGHFVGFDVLASLWGPPPAPPDNSWRAWREKLARPLYSWIALSRRDASEEADRYWRSMAAEFHADLWERDEPSPEASLRAWNENWLSRMRYAPLLAVLPSLTRAAFMAEIATQNRDAALVAIGIVLFMRDHERYPTTLTELTPQYLPAVPLDRYDGRPLKYVVRDGVPIVYSVGVDRDDDGGRHGMWNERIMNAGPRRFMYEWISPRDVKAAAQSGTNPARGEIPDTDWILWPPIEE